MWKQFYLGITEKHFGKAGEIFVANQLTEFLPTQTTTDKDSNKDPKNQLMLPRLTITFIKGGESQVFSF